jgi:SNF2 family DNA or RNA helicase
MRKQCIGRIYRKGQEKKCLVVDFVMGDSLDQRVIERRSERFDLVRVAMEYIKDFHKSTEEVEV